MIEIEDSWNILEQQCKNCTKCELYKTKTNTVFGRGSKTAKILFIGEAPGEQEDLQGIPFCGASGQLLDKYIAATDIHEDEFYIGNILKCRPPHNRDPLPEEQDACIGYLRNQVALIKPKIIVCLGRIAAKRLIDPEFRITRQHGSWVQKGGIWMTAIYHPSALLRDVAKRPETFDDLLSIRAKIQETGARI